MPEPVSVSRIEAAVKRFFLAAFASLSLLIPHPGLAADGTVHAVLFYSPTCPHCQMVLAVDLPPLAEKYGSQLQIAIVDVSSQQGGALYKAAIQSLHIPQERFGVPTLIVGNTVLVGDVEIPQEFPGIIEQGLAQGGIPWPDIPGLLEGLPPELTTQAAATSPASAQPSPQPSPATPLPPVASASIETALSRPSYQFSLANLAIDPAGSTLALVVMAVMLIALVAGGFRLARQTPRRPWPSSPWLFSLLALAGLAVAAYLTYIEVTQGSAVCGPVGDCNTVQSSPFAQIAGLVPVAPLGGAAYLLILVGALLAPHLPRQESNLASISLMLTTGAATLFSLYLTVLEPFVIGATCLWCLTSALLSTALFWISIAPANFARAELNGARDRSRPA
jgi:uncharacterized membrane protein/thiol-disulfide isomerase/thioredoxin